MFAKTLFYVAFAVLFVAKCSVGSPSSSFGDPEKRKLSKRKKDAKKFAKKEQKKKGDAGSVEHGSGEVHLLSNGSPAACVNARNLQGVRCSDNTCCCSERNNGGFDFNLCPTGLDVLPEPVTCIACNDGFPCCTPFPNSGFSFQCCPNGSQYPYPGKNADGSDKRSSATIGVSIYYPQVSVDTAITAFGHPTTQHFVHMGVYWVPYDVQNSGGKTQTYLAEDGPDMPGAFPPTSYHADGTCDVATENFPLFRDAYNPSNSLDLTQKGFEVTYSNGPSATDFSKYDQTLAVGSPGRYTTGSGSTNIWSPAADVSIWMQTDLSAEDFFLTAENLARNMNYAGGYGPQSNCQDFSINLLTELRAPDSMILKAERYRLSSYDRAFLETGCSLGTRIDLPIEMCGNFGFKTLTVPPQCHQPNPKYKFVVPQFGEWGWRLNRNSCWADGKQCVNHVSCGNCCNGWYFPGAGIEPFCGPTGEDCWKHGTECFSGISCGACCNGSQGTLFFHQCK